MRRTDWVEQLWRVVKAYDGVPFEYGRHDCCLFVARCIDAMTDSDLAWTLAYHYHDEPSALAFIRHECGIERAVSGFLGDTVDGLPRRGDVAMVPTERGDGVGMCVGTTIAVAGDGVEFYPLSAALKTWRVD